jgi:hypothetical protein
MRWPWFRGLWLLELRVGFCRERESCWQQARLWQEDHNYVREGKENAAGELYRNFDLLSDTTATWQCILFHGLPLASSRSTPWERTQESGGLLSSSRFSGRYLYPSRTEIVEFYFGQKKEFWVAHFLLYWYSNALFSSMKCMYILALCSLNLMDGTSCKTVSTHS